MDWIDFFEQPSNSLESQSNNNNFNNRIVKFLLYLKSVADRAHYCNYYSKDDVIAEMKDVKQGIYLEKGVSFLPSDERKKKYVSKDAVMKVIKKTDFILALKTCVIFYINYTKHEIVNLDTQCDLIDLINIADDVVATVLSFERAKIGEIDEVMTLIMDFLLYLIDSIAKMNKKCYYEDSPFFYMKLVLKFKEIKLAQQTVIRNIIKKIVLLTVYLKSSKSKLDAIKKEALVILLNTLKHILEFMSFNGEVKRVDQHQLCQALENIMTYLPDDINSFIETTLEHLC